MRKLFILLGFLTSVSLISCDKLKEEQRTLNGEFVEIDATVLNNPVSGKEFPLLTKVPADGRPVITADPNLTRASGLVRLRVNLVAPQRGNAERLTYKVIPTETTAVAGTHYNISGTLEIPANSSFGYIEVQVLNPGASTGTRDLVLELEGNTSLRANANYNKVGLRIAQN